jgi:hypothetical protein
LTELSLFITLTKQTQNFERYLTFQQRVVSALFAQAACTLHNIRVRATNECAHAEKLFHFFARGSQNTDEALWPKHAQRGEADEPVA